MSLKNQTIKGLKWSTISSIGNALIQIIQLAILARILSPEDFGLMALVMVVIGFSQMFVDMGISNAIIYKQTINKPQLSTLYWLNIIIGIILFIAIVFLAKPISAIYENSQLIPLIKLVAITFLISPWGQQFLVLLQKKLKFDAIAKTDIISRLLSFTGVLILAFNGFGVYSLAAGSVFFAFFSTIGYNIFGRKLYQPSLKFQIESVKEFLSFGLYQMGEKAINFFAKEFDTILIGKFLGIEALGIYNVSKNLVNKPSKITNPIITKVTFPVMSKINHDLAKLKSIFLKTINYLSYINFPVYFLIALLAEPLIILMFGNEWQQSIPIVQVLAFVFLLRSIGNPAGSLLLSRGRADIAFYWGLGKLILYPVFIIVGSKFDIFGVTISLLVLNTIIYFLNWRIIVLKTCNASFTEYLNAIKKPLLFSLLPALLILLISFFQLEIFLFASISIILFSMLYAITFIKFDTKSFIEFKTMILHKS